MGQEALAEANRRIAQSEALDLFDSDRLGLFVVSRLASRHGIKVHLRTSPYGGTTAVILLPTALLHSGAAERSPEDPRPLKAQSRLSSEAAHEEAAHKEAARTAAEPEEHRYARVPADSPRQEPVAAPADRPALVAPVPAAAQTTTTRRPTGAPALRLHPSTGRSSGRSGDRSPDRATESDDLPRRVRQASLAPQLRNGRPEEAAQPVPPHDPDERTPERVRDRMAAYRDGWTRGGGRQPGRGAPPGATTVRDTSEGDPA
jgi:hypothetical protein